MDIQEYLESIGRINPTMDKPTKEEKPEPALLQDEKCEPSKKTYFLHVTPQAENWTKTISELETYFAEITLPIQPIKLNTCSTITDVSLFIDSHLAIVKANNGNYSFLPYLNRLQELKEVCKNIKTQQPWKQ